MLRKKSALFFVLIAMIFLAGVLLLRDLKSSKTKISSFDHAADYSWISGRIEHQDLEGGFWIIKYNEANDKFGGKFVLGNDPRLTNFQNGDIVKITGKISENQISIYQAGILYQLESIQKLK